MAGMEGGLRRAPLVMFWVACVALTTVGCVAHHDGKAEPSHDETIAREKTIDHYEATHDDETIGQMEHDKRIARHGTIDHEETIELAAPQKARLRRTAPLSAFVQDMIRRAARGRASVLSVGDTYDDFPSVAVTSKGEVYVAYAAFTGNCDQVRLHRFLRRRRWNTYTPVPLAEPKPDIWMPQLAADGRGRLWLVWSEQLGWQRPGKGNWELFARWFDGTQWGPLVRLTDQPGPDINHRVYTAANGTIHVVWQAHPKGNADIYYTWFNGNEWQPPRAITSDEASDWFPDVAVDARGVPWVVFDSYRNGDYDVFLTAVSGPQAGKLIPIATSGYYEAHPTIACGRDGRIWIAWEQGGWNWGKDHGYWLLREERSRGTFLGAWRTVRVVCWQDGRLYAAPELDRILVQRDRPTAQPRLAVGPDGRVWLRFRQSIRRRARRRFRRCWVELVTYLGPNGWAPARVLPASAGRISVFARIWPTTDGGLWVAYSGDGRSLPNLHRPVRDTVMVLKIRRPRARAGIPEELPPYTPPEPPEGIQPWDVARERAAVAAIRKHRVELRGQQLHIVRGDLHRHTELSWDVGPGKDGSYLDFYRYMIDVAAMDFGAITDHQGGGQYEYHWWLTQKSADLFYIPPRFVPLYGYERSVRYPHGHRNIFHAYRGVPVFAFRLKPDQTGIFPGLGTGAVLDDDTQLLFEFLRRSGGISIPHTSGTATMGTDWRDNDPVVEPVVEIYQGGRNSYEAPGAPRVHPENEPPEQAPGVFEPKGLVWNAWAKGYRLGVIASSDHGSTHISYALVYTPKSDRAAIIEAIRQRHTYAATDNVIVEFRADGHFMGEEYETDQPPTLTLRVTGTAPIARVDLIRSGQYIYTAAPGKRHVVIEHTDRACPPGTHWYYFRIVQADGEIAWASPIWVTRK